MRNKSPDDDITEYAYDAAGRLVKEGEKTYEYGWLDKVMRVTEYGKELARFEYHNNNQLAKVVRENGIETFEWDGLALIERSGTKYINEPHPGGGNPVLAIGSGNTEAIFTDMLGTSLGTVRGREYSQITKTSFGADSNSADSFFTGKPHVEDLGYAFLFRNYRADMGKWLSQDLIGYPDGWNNLAYCGNSVIANIDYNGLWTVQIGITLSGGSLLGGSISFGIAIGYSSEAGYTAGFYTSASGGMDAGYSIGASITGTHTGYGSIDALSGTATRVTWPFAWIEPEENYISFGWNILRASEKFSLKYKDIMEIKKIYSIFFKTYQIIHNDKSISKFLLISTRHQYVWDIIIKKLKYNNINSI